MIALKSWILSIVVVSVICAIVITLTEKTASTRIVKTTASLALILTILYPLRQLQFPDYEQIFTSATVEVSTQQTIQLQKQLAEEKLALYLESYAQTIGCNCTTSVQCTEQEGALYPESVEIRYKTENGEQFAKLAEKIQSEFGITADQIAYIEGT